MDISTSRRQPQRGAALLAATFLAFTTSAAMAEPSPAGLTVDPLPTSGPSVTTLRQQTVSYGDLDLDTAGGLETFNQRIAAAVRNVCAYGDARDLYTIRDVRECRERSHSQATVDIEKLDGAAAFGTK